MALEKSSTKVKITSAIIILVLILITGLAGYMIIEGYNFIDALYMTIITISTVGYGEISSLSLSGRLFTIFLIITSFGTYAYAISIITTYFVEGNVGAIIHGKRFKRASKKMENHIIICGYGRNGQQAGNELNLYNEAFVVIDQKAELADTISEKIDKFIEGDATQDEVLLNADIKTAKSIITTLPNDADNLYVVITARALNPKLKIISRASNDSSEKKLRMAGVDSVVLPEKVGGAHMAKLIARPDILEFLDHLSVRGNAATNLEEIVCNKLPKKLINKSINEIQIRKETGANIVGFKTAEGDYIINPKPDTKMQPNSKLFVLGTPEEIERMREFLRETAED